MFLLINGDIIIRSGPRSRKGCERLLRVVQHEDRKLYPSLRHASAAVASGPTVKTNLSAGSDLERRFIIVCSALIKPKREGSESTSDDERDTWLLKTPLPFDPKMQSCGIFHPLCVAKTNNLLPVSVFTLQVLSVRRSPSWHPVFKTTADPPRASVSPSSFRYSRQTRSPTRHLEQRESANLRRCCCH